jgi:hypothetical protein
MKPFISYTLSGLGALALIAIIAGASITGSYFLDKKTAVRLQNEALAEELALRTPDISIEGISCDLDDQAKTQNYSATIRTMNATIVSAQKDIETLVTSLGGTIVGSWQSKVNDREAGYSNSASIQASLPLAQGQTFIAQLKKRTVAPEYLENESFSTQNSRELEQACERTLGSIKSRILSEKLYLDHIYTGSQPPMPPEDTNPFTYAFNQPESFVKGLERVRDDARSYMESLTNASAHLNTMDVRIDVREIPG